MYLLINYYSIQYKHIIVIKTIKYVNKDNTLQHSYLLDFKIKIKEIGNINITKTIRKQFIYQEVCNSGKQK